MKNSFGILFTVLLSLHVAKASHDPVVAHMAEFLLTQDLTTRGLPLLIEQSNLQPGVSSIDHHSVSYSRLKRAYLLKNIEGKVTAKAVVHQRKTTEGSSYISLELKSAESKTIGYLDFYREEENAVIRNANGDIAYFSEFSDQSGSRLLIRDVHGRELVWLERPFSSWVKEGDRWRIRMDQSQSLIDPRFFFFLADYISTEDKKKKDSTYYSYLAGHTYNYGTYLLQNLYFFDVTMSRINQRYDYHFALALNRGLPYGIARSFSDQMKLSKDLAVKDPARLKELEQKSNEVIDPAIPKEQQEKFNKAKELASKEFIKLKEQEEKSVEAKIAAVGLLFNFEEDANKSLLALGNTLRYGKLADKSIHDILNEIDKLPKDVTQDQIKNIFEVDTKKLGTEYRKKMLRIYPDKIKQRWISSDREGVVDEFIAYLDSKLQTLDRQVERRSNSTRYTDTEKASDIREKEKYLGELNQIKSNRHQMIENDQELDNVESVLTKAMDARIREMTVISGARDSSVDELANKIVFFKNNGQVKDSVDWEEINYSRAEKGTRSLARFFKRQYGRVKRAMGFKVNDPADHPVLQDSPPSAKVSEDLESEEALSPDPDQAYSHAGVEEDLSTAVVVLPNPKVSNGSSE